MYITHVRAHAITLTQSLSMCALRSATYCCTLRYKNARTREFKNTCDNDKFHFE